MERLWTYWEGPRAPFIQVCLDSMRRQAGDNFTLLTPSNWREYVPEGTLHPGFADLQKPAHRADCIRAAVMALRGGMYADADTVFLRPPVFTQSGFLCSIWTKDPPRVLNGYLRAPAGHPVAAAWLAGVNASLAAPPAERGWTSLGEGVLTPLILRPAEGGGYTREVAAADVTLVPLSTWLPIDVDADPRQLRQLRDWRDFVTPETVCFGLNHSWMRHHHRHETLAPSRLWSSRGPLWHRLVRDAKEQSI